MSEFKSQYNRAVWFDIPVANLERAARFYAAVLDLKVSREQFEDFSFCVLEHENGNGGCLIPNPEEVSSNTGILLYLNADGRIRNAVFNVEGHGGRILEPIHSIGPHGFRAIVLDSEGKRFARHSNSDS